MQVFQIAGTPLYDLQFTPDGRRLLVSAQTRVLIDTLGSDPPRLLKPPTGAFTAHARFVLGETALVYTTPTDNNHVHVWNLATNQIAIWDGAGGREAHSVAASPDGTTVYVVYVTAGESSWRTELRAFDAATGELKGRFPTREGHFSRLTMSANGRRLAGYGSFSVGVWDLTAPDSPESGFAEIRPGKLRRHVEGIALSADGTRLATVSSHGVTLWDISNGADTREVFRSGEHRRGVRAVACSPTKPMIATGDTLGNVFLWDHTGRVLTRYDWGLGHIFAMCFAPDGLRCAAVDVTGKVVIWDVDV